ncbi:uncharacterized protein GGS22DRAFT_131321 [Annulohypoxylon maeteangense]|uniref:uncharacterized protein n=1 Tax=Annulohypoxylon maeteangense TaxID=1927788 RepID=UPI002007B269|nr:uncharacterized protein GGS22DRAFT_131321 [Annulohypoxylon maeteangense]KAI0885614.1 hypothetical protein GGS22DRAFT_131321 [Annulohypoxylon maeteangense]
MVAGPRLTGPAAKLARSITTTATASQSNTLLTSTKSTTAPLSRKYAELLKERNIDPDHPRHLYTRSSNRPHPPPRTMRLMQTFGSSAPKAALATTTMDNIVFPGSASLEGSRDDPFAHLRVPLLPDNFATHHTPEVADGPIAPAQISIVAANPELVSPSALTEVEGMGMDGVELKFAHEETPAEREQGTLTDIWKGLVDDVLGSSSGKHNVAL